MLKYKSKHRQMDPRRNCRLAGRKGVCRRKALGLAPAAAAPRKLPARLPLLAAPVAGCWGCTELLSSSKKEDGEETGRPRHTVCLSFQHLPVSPRFTVKVTLPLSRRALCWCGFAAHQMELVPVCRCSRSATSLGTGPGRLRRGWRRAQDHIQQDCSCRETFTGLSAITRPQSRRMQPMPSPTCCPAALNPAAEGQSVLLALQGHPAASRAVMMKLPGKISKN